VGIFTETGESGRAALSEPSQEALCSVSGPTRLSGLCGLTLSVEWSTWTAIFFAASMTSKNCDREGDRDGRRPVSFERQRPILASCRASGLLTMTS
jgi:hypothetical protein